MDFTAICEYVYNNFLKNGMSGIETIYETDEVYAFVYGTNKRNEVLYGPNPMIFYKGNSTFDYLDFSDTELVESIENAKQIPVPDKYQPKYID